MLMMQVDNTPCFPSAKSQSKSFILMSQQVSPSSLCLPMFTALPKTKRDRKKIQKVKLATHASPLKIVIQKKTPL